MFVNYIDLESQWLVGVVYRLADQTVLPWNPYP